ncbi:MAG: hypothetical protein LBC78_02295 [Oscillospiraceae bacterium]|jgi:hypothetical protein|nr:hypothetical protein [Oscillospiraceae bacterium]
MKNGSNRSGTQALICRHCKKTYTPEAKRRAYSEEARSLAMKMYYSGVCGRDLGKILGMSKANVYNRIKKTAQILEDDYHILELDEMYCYLNKRPRTETRENVYVMTVVSRRPRQIVGFDAASDKSASHIQNIVDTAPRVKKYCTDGYYG